MKHIFIKASVLKKMTNSDVPCDRFNKNKYRRMKKSIILFSLLMSTYIGVAQQDAQFTQYMYNTITVNPAYAGSRGQLSLMGLYRTQWVGLEGAPKTMTFNVHSPIENSNVGYGLSIINDVIGNGVNTESYFDGTISYTIKTSDKDKLSFGVKVGGHLLNVDYDKLRRFDEEPISAQNIDNKFSPNFGAGIYFHNQKFYVGLSIPNMLETEHFDRNKNSNNTDGSGNTVSYLETERINYYLIAGYVFDLNPNLKFKPAILTKAVYGAPLQVDMSANLLFNDKFSLGAAYRLDAAVSALLGFQVTEGLMIGMAYDKEVTNLGQREYNSGSFEVFLRFELIKSVEKVISPRFF